MATKRHEDTQREVQKRMKSDASDGPFLSSNVDPDCSLADEKLLDMDASIFAVLNFEEIEKDTSNSKGNECGQIELDNNNIGDTLTNLQLDGLTQSFQQIDNVICAHSKEVSQTKGPGPVVVASPDNSEELTRAMCNNMFNTSCTMKWTQEESRRDYKKQVNAVFDNLEMSILSNVALDSSLQSAVQHDEEFQTLGPWYGLPMLVAELIQQHKGVERLYDWQDECLRLEAVAARHNLVYSLPTSGGKTLVSEVLIMREVLCRKKNALLVLPYVSIVQEKLWTMSPFAVQLDFLLEEYAAGKGRLPPCRRRHKRSVYVATIEKACALVNSLTEAGRLHELGLVVVDELHLVGERDRGCTLETLLTRLLHARPCIQIVGMSATIGNLPELCRFLHAELFTKNFRPVELEEYVCSGDKMARHVPGHPVRAELRTSRWKGYTEDTRKEDPDRLAELVLDVAPEDSCLVFCATKRNCENVALLLTRIMKSEARLSEHRRVDRQGLMRQMQAEGAVCNILRQTLPLGVAYHHAGLTMDERRLIEDAFRAGTICVICCTSTLAAGVNLPAKRVIVRSPYVGLEFISLARYKQMAGRAGRAGYSEVGQSILVCERRDVGRVIQLLNSPMDQANSLLAEEDGCGLQRFVLGCIALGLASTRRELQQMTARTLLAVQSERLNANIKALTDQAIRDLFKQGALQTDNLAPPPLNTSVQLEQTGGTVQNDASSSDLIVIRNDTRLSISKLGRAAIKAGMDLESARLLHDDLVQAQAGVVLLDCLHLLYLVTPYDLCSQLRPQPTIFYNKYMELGPRELQAARVIGITEACAVHFYSGRLVRSIPERVFTRFYLTLMLRALWSGSSVAHVATDFIVSRGLVQKLMTSAATFSGNVVHFCTELDELWPFAELLGGMTRRLQHCCSGELQPLMELPAVKLSRARQLYRAGYSTLQHIARADPAELAQQLEHLSRKVATHLVATAKLLLLEKVENLREEAEDVLEGITTLNNTFS